MSFRRNKEESHKWQKWLLLHRDELSACGIPGLVLADIRHGYYFLEHGYYTPLGSAEPVICIDRMNKAEKERLCKFLASDDLYPDCTTLKDLKSLLKT